MEELIIKPLEEFAKINNLTDYQLMHEQGTDDYVKVLVPNKKKIKSLAHLGNMLTLANKDSEGFLKCKIGLGHRNGYSDEVCVSKVFREHNIQRQLLQFFENEYTYCDDERIIINAVNVSTLNFLVDELRLFLEEGAIERYYFDGAYKFFNYIRLKLKENPDLIFRIRGVPEKLIPYKVEAEIDLLNNAEYFPVIVTR